MVYFVALAVIVAITMFGLGGISARFGGNTQKPASVQSTQGSQQANANIQPESLNTAPQANQGQTVPTIPTTENSIPTNVPAAGPVLIPTSTPVPVLPLPVVSVQPTIPVPPANPPDSAPAQPQAYTPLEAQGGVITGEASTPFYVVQSGDTLSQIAQGLGVDVNALVSVNNLQDDLIYPEQVLYLPFNVGGQSPSPTDAPSQPQQPAVTPVGQGGQNEQGGPAGPVAVVPTPIGTDMPQVPDMPNTGINNKR